MASPNPIKGIMGSRVTKARIDRYTSLMVALLAGLYVFIAVEWFICVPANIRRASSIRGLPTREFIPSSLQDRPSQTSLVVYDVRDIIASSTAPAPNVPQSPISFTYPLDSVTVSDPRAWGPPYERSRVDDALSKSIFDSLALDPRDPFDAEKRGTIAIWAHRLIVVETPEMHGKIVSVLQMIRATDRIREAEHGKASEVINSDGYQPRGNIASKLDDDGLTVGGPNATAKLKIYDVRDLLAPIIARQKLKSSWSEYADSILENEDDNLSRRILDIDSDTWANPNGIGVVRCWSGRLFVRQLPAQQHHVAELLDKLRKGDEKLDETP